MPIEPDLIVLCVFLTALSLSRNLANLLKQSPFIPYLITGTLLGPSVAGVIPNTDGLILFGFLGVTLNILDAGLYTQTSHIRSCAPRALSVAILGIVIPIAGACVVMLLFERATLRTAMSVGSAIAPRSLAVVAALLADTGLLQSELGVLISVAAVVDDVLSLVLLSQLNAVDEHIDHSSGDPNAGVKTWTFIEPVMFSVFFLVISLCLSCYIVPNFTRRFSQRFNQHTNCQQQQQRMAMLNMYMFILFTIGMMALAVNVETSTLLAAYVSGVAFSHVPHIHRTWEKSLKQIIPALNALFFAATIGFVIPPLGMLFEREAVVLGMLLTVVSVVGKLACGLAMCPNWRTHALPVAVAMLGRGEFGFLIAAQARTDSLLSGPQYAAVIWAVMIPTLLAPILFRPAFALHERQNQNNRDAKHTNSSGRDSDDTFHTAACTRLPPQHQCECGEFNQSSDGQGTLGKKGADDEYRDDDNSMMVNNVPVDSKRRATHTIVTVSDSHS